MSDQNKSVYADRIEAIRYEMNKLNLDALIVTHDDEYLSYELNPSHERIKYLSGFSGSAGYVVIVKEKDTLFSDRKKEISIEKASTEDGITVEKDCAVFVDGRYVVQVKEQIDNELYQDFNFQKISVCDYLRAVLKKNSTVGVDMNCISYKEFTTIKEDLENSSISLVDTVQNLTDKVWTDRPEITVSPFELFSDEYNGCPSPQKRRELSLTLRQKDLDATIICDPTCICWLLNIRGADRKYLPVINSRLVAYSNEAIEWYVNPGHLSDIVMEEFSTHAGHVDIFPEDRFDEVLERLSSASCRIYVDPNDLNAHILEKLYHGSSKVVEGTGLCQTPKAAKNHIEVAGEYKAHIKDGIAMCRFFAWLDTDVTRLDGVSADDEHFAHRVSDTTEKDLAEKAESLRKVESAYKGLSFATISAIGPNAAMCHYNHEEVLEPRALGRDSIYLIDSGAHFQDGTTDITRTVMVGPNVTDEIKRMYTLVLKCHISLATLVFPKGTSGLQIDAIARRPLWDLGLDYAHGTGHGVGHVLSVHEGPQGISTKYSLTPLQPGMIISNEPGYYKEGEYGIRLENLQVVIPCTQPGMSHMLCFSPLTLVPFDRRLIIRELLSQNEIDWLNNYHKNVNNVITNAASTLTESELSWLNQATLEI